MKILREGALETLKELLDDATRHPERKSTETLIRGVPVTELLAAEIPAAVWILLRNAEAPWAGN